MSRLMSRVYGLWWRVRHDETGAEYVEYAVIGGIAVLVILAAIQFFFGSLATVFRNIAQTLLEIG